MSDDQPTMAQLSALVDKLQRQVNRQNAEISYLNQRTEEFAAKSDCWFWETDPNHFVVYLSKNFEAASGLSRDGFIGNSRLDIIAQSDEGKKNAHTEQLSKHQPFEAFQYSRKDPKGDTRTVVDTGWPVFNRHGEFAGYRGTGADREIQKHREVRLPVQAVPIDRQSHTNFTMLIDNLRQSLMWFDQDGKLIHCNKRVTEIHGFASHEVQEIKSLRDYALLLAAKGELGDGSQQDLASEHLCFINGELRQQNSARIHLCRQDRYLRARYAELPGGGCVITHVDVSKEVALEQELSEASRRAAETAKLLQHQRNELTTVLDNLSQSIMWYDKNGNLRLRNKEVGVLHNIPADKLRNVRNFADHIRILAERGDLGKGTLPDILKASKARVFGKLEGRLTYRKYFPVNKKHINITVAETPDGGRILSEVDITKQIEAELELAKALELVENANHALEDKVEARTRELRSLQESLIKAERDATMSELIAKLSHELRNPLNALNTSLYVIRSKVGDDPRLEKAFDRSERTIRRCTRILTDLHDFAMTRELKRQPVKISEWVEEQTRQLKLPDEVTFDYSNKLPAISLEIDRKPLAKATWKLLRNALQALAGSDMQDKEKRLRLHLYQSGDRVIFEIGDNGPGMAQDICSKALEPLFSTRGFGVGLGLPIAQQVFERHGGGIDIESAVGKGTVVRAWLPAHARCLRAA